MKKQEEYTSDEEFAELKASFQQAIEHARGERHDLRTTVLPAPPKPMKKHEIVGEAAAACYLTRPLDTAHKSISK